MQEFSQRFSFDDTVVDVNVISDGSTCVVVEFETQAGAYLLDDNEIYEFIHLGMLPKCINIPKNTIDEISKYIIWVTGHLVQSQ